VFNQIEFNLVKLFLGENRLFLSSAAMLAPATSIKPLMNHTTREKLPLDWTTWHKANHFLQGCLNTA
jgi:hypothetical protein